MYNFIFHVTVKKIEDILGISRRESPAQEESNTNVDGDSKDEGIHSETEDEGHNRMPCKNMMKSLTFDYVTLHLLKNINRVSQWFELERAFALFIKYA